MKTLINMLIGAVGIMFLSGCASTPVYVSLVGPKPAGHVSLGGAGYLQVFSDTETHYIGDGPAFHPHMAYNIYDEDGKRVKWVPNHFGNMDQTPTVVRIPAGDFTVRANSSGYGRINVPVVIEAGKETVIHLDGAWRPTGYKVDHDIVRLPDGQAVGWNGALTRLSE